MSVLVLRGVWSSWSRDQVVGGHTFAYPASLAVGEGEWLAVVGRNGVGKSSLLRAISGTAPISGGIIEVDGHRLRHRKPRDRHFASVTYVGQKAAYPGTALKWADAVALATAWRHGLHNEDAIESLRAELIRLRVVNGHQITPRLFDVVTAIICAPRVLLLDEVSTLFPSHLRGVLSYDLIRRLLPTTTVLFVEHDFSIVERIANRVVLLQDGLRPIVARCADRIAMSEIEQKLPPIAVVGTPSDKVRENADKLLTSDYKPREILLATLRAAGCKQPAKVMSALEVNFPFLKSRGYVEHLSGGQRVILTRLAHAFVKLGSFDEEMIKHVDGTNLPALEGWVEWADYYLKDETTNGDQ